MGKLLRPDWAREEGEDIGFSLAPCVSLTERISLKKATEKKERWRRESLVLKEALEHRIYWLSDAPTREPFDRTFYRILGELTARGQERSETYRLAVAARNLHEEPVRSPLFREARDLARHWTMTFSETRPLAYFVLLRGILHDIDDLPVEYINEVVTEVLHECEPKVPLYRGALLVCCYAGLETNHAQLYRKAAAAFPAAFMGWKEHF